MGGQKLECIFKIQFSRGVVNLDAVSHVSVFSLHISSKKKWRPFEICTKLSLTLGLPRGRSHVPIQVFVRLKLIVVIEAVHCYPEI